MWPSPRISYLYGPMWNNLPVSLAAHHDWYLVACAAGTVLLLLVLIARVKLHPALSLAVAAFALGIASGMPLKQVPLSFTGGVGNLMGHIAIVLGLGAILGRLLASSGGAMALGSALVDGCGPRGLPWALMGMGILVGMPVFFEVGLVLLMPIVAEAARRSGKSADSGGNASAGRTLDRAWRAASASGCNAGGCAVSRRSGTHNLVWHGRRIARRYAGRARAGLADAAPLAEAEGAGRTGVCRGRNTSLCGGS